MYKSNGCRDTDGKSGRHWEHRLSGNRREHVSRFSAQRQPDPISCVRCAALKETTA